MNTAISGKATKSHTHTISDITNLQSTLDGKALKSHTHSYLPLAGGKMSGNIEFSDTDIAGIFGTQGENDCWRVVGRHSSIDQGYLELATADGGAESIVARQYNGNDGGFTRIGHEAFLLDGNGNTQFPRTLYLGKELADNGILIARGTDNNAVLYGDGNIYLRHPKVTGWLTDWIDIKTNKSGDTITGTFNFNNEMPPIILNSNSWPRYNFTGNNGFVNWDVCRNGYTDCSINIYDVDTGEATIRYNADTGCLAATHDLDVGWGYFFRGIRGHLPASTANAPDGDMLWAY